MELYSKKLTIETWDDFYHLFEKHNGVRGGCWCAYYLGRPKDFVFSEKEKHIDIHREYVERYGSTGILVYHGENAIGYCQVAKHYVIERFNFSRGYKNLGDIVKDKQEWRISCIFVDKEFRKMGIASQVFEFAIEHIKNNGGGWLEVFPFEGDKINSDKFNFNGSVNFFKKHGFEKVAKLGSIDVLMRKFIEPY